MTEREGIRSRSSRVSSRGRVMALPSIFRRYALGSMMGVAPWFRIKNRELGTMRPWMNSSRVSLFSPRSMKDSGGYDPTRPGAAGVGVGVGAGGGAGEGG